ncbi:MAG TPA: urease subunit gamma [Thiobacillus sp.]
MFLSMQEQERLMVYTAGKLAIERRDRGLKLNLPEATALLTSFILEGARDGETVVDLMEAGRHVLSRDDVMEGVADMLAQVQVEATFRDGTKLVTLTEPVR